MIFEKICELLDKSKAKYIVKEHKATPTSIESAKARGESLNIGAKALVVKVKSGFCLCVIPANRRLDTKKVKKVVKSKSLRFASEEELKELTGLPKGAVPPFGEFLGMDMVVDLKQFDEEYMAFNAGELTKSIKMKSSDYREIVKPKVADIS